MELVSSHDCTNVGKSGAKYHSMNNYGSCYMFDALDS